MQSYTFSDGKVMSYEDFGKSSKKVILIHHGLVTSPLDEGIWGSYCEQRGMRLILPHRSGHDGSSYFSEESYLDLAKRFVELLDALGVDKFAICGISAGAPHSYATGFLCKQKALGVYIYSGLGAIYDDEVLRGYGEYYDKLKSLYHFARSNTREKTGEFFVQKYKQYERELWELIKERSVAVGYEIALQAKEWGFRVSDLQSPIVIRHSKADTKTPFLAALNTAKIIPNSEFIEVSDEPHFTEKAFTDFLELIISRI